MDLSTVPAPEDVAEWLQIANMFASDRPVQLAVSYLPVSIAGGEEIALPDTGPTGLYKRLAKRGHRVVRFTEDIEARRPRRDEAAFLQLTEAQQVLVVVRVAYGADGTPLETVFNVFPSQQWRLSYEWTVN